jgi:hypothetical protein
MFTNFSTFMLVAHRNMISVYDMRTKEWIKPYKAPHMIRYFTIRQESDEKLNKMKQRAIIQADRTGNLVRDIDIFNRFRLILVSGINSIQVLTLQANGNLQLKKGLTEGIANQRILKFVRGNVPSGRLGFTMLTDNGNASNFYMKQTEEEYID